MGWWLALVSIAAAGVPDDVRPVVVEAGAPARYGHWRARRGLEAQTLVCGPLWPTVSELCFHVSDDGERRWVHGEDLARWSVDLDTLRAEVSRRARAHVAEADWVRIEGMEARYLRVSGGDGWAAAGVLHPEALRQRLGGGPVRAAMPAQGVMVAYRGRSPELDRVMAVGIRELFETLPGSVSPRVFEWAGSGWRPFGLAVPR